MPIMYLKTCRPTSDSVFEKIVNTLLRKCELLALLLLAF